jgi:hypothetical protein
LIAKWDGQLMDDFILKTDSNPSNPRAGKIYAVAIISVNNYCKLFCGSLGLNLLKFSVCIMTLKRVFGICSF